MRYSTYPNHLALWKSQSCRNGGRSATRLAAPSSEESVVPRIYVILFLAFAAWALVIGLAWFVISLLVT